MADITMCLGINCPIKDKCHRYTAQKEWVQYCFTSSPYDHDKKECNQFWDNTERTKEEKMTPTFPDNWDPLRSSRLFQPIQSPREKVELLKQRINQHLDQKGVINPQVRLELIKIILEDLEQFE
jgi:hypothetical protein